MIQKGFLWKRAIVVLFLFLCSCSKSFPEWEYGRVITSCPAYNSGRLLLRPENPFRGLELELSCGCSGLRMYVNAFSLAFPKEEGCSSKTKILISSDQESYTVFADRLEGGQRLLLPPEAAQNIIRKLLACKTIFISAGRYKSEIVPRGFSEAYHKLVKNSA